MSAAPLPPEPDYVGLHEEVLSAYTAQGLDRKLVGGWAISDNDYEDFIRLAIEANPRRVLEVGTYVGVSTMLLARACPNAEIFTVDPDFPLSVESKAVNVGSRESVTETTHSIARKAAEILGVADRIHFIRGGFAVGETFASALRESGATTTIVGPELCKKEGPFDFVFVDGLHTQEAVTADLTLAASALESDGKIVLHDCIGFWGAQVRAGIFDFLRAQPDYQFTHQRYDALYRSLGVIRRRPKKSVNDRVRLPKGQASAIAATFLKVARSAIGEGQIVEIARKSPVLAKRGSTVVACRIGAKSTIGDKISEAIDSSGPSGFFSADVADFVEDEGLSSIFASICDSGRPLVLVSTPPGEHGVAGPYSRPLARILDLAAEKRLNAFAYPALELESSRFPLLPEPRELGLSSLYATVTVFAGRDEFADSKNLQYVRLSAWSAAEREQLELQRTHIAASFRHYLSGFEIRGKMIAALEEASRNLQEKTAALASALDASRTELGVCKADLESLGAERDALRADLDVHKADLQSLGAERDALRADLDATRTELTAAGNEIQSLELELKAQRKMSDQMLFKLVDAYRSIDVIDSELTWQIEMIQTSHALAHQPADEENGDERLSN